MASGAVQYELQEQPNEDDYFIAHDLENNKVDNENDSETEKLIENYFSTKRTCCQILLFVVLFLLGGFAGFFIHEAAIDEKPKTCPQDTPSHQKDLEQLREMHRNVIGNMSSSNIQVTADFLSKQYQKMQNVEDKTIPDFIARKFKSYNFDSVETIPYKITLAYPVKSHPSSLQIVNSQDDVIYSKLFEYEGQRSYTFPNGTRKSVVSVGNKDEEDSMQDSKLPMFYAYSKNGSAQGAVVYVHYGRKEDFKTVKNLGIDMAGKIVLMRYGRNRLNEKVTLAEQYGAVGALFYLDPADSKLASKDWYITPQGIPDPFTYGFPAKEGYLSRPKGDAVTSIPVQPISTQDAYELMKRLNGVMAPELWQGGMNVTYYVGRKVQSDASLRVRMEVINQKVQKTLYNVIGTVAGYSDGNRDRFVMVGSHRGPVDEYNGTAIMLEIARNLNRIRKDNWTPKRTIKMCSWGVVHGVLGSVEWAEEHKQKLLTKGVAYIDVDMPVQGDYVLQVEATESMSRIIPTVASMVTDPSSIDESSVYKGLMEKLNPKKKPIESLGVASDYLVFPHQLGIATINMQYVPANHTQIDEYYTPPKFVDTNFVYHKLMAQLYGQTVLSLLDATVLQFDFKYTHLLIDDYILRLNESCASQLRSGSLAAVKTASSNFQTAVTNLQTDLTPNGEIFNDAIKLRIVNDLLTQLERNFLVDGQMKYANQMYRHILYSKRAYTTFPAVAEIQDTSNKQWNCDSVEDLLPIIQYCLDSGTDLLTPDDNVWWWGN